MTVCLSQSERESHDLKLTFNDETSRVWSLLLEDIWKLALKSRNHVLLNGDIDHRILDLKGV